MRIFKIFRLIPAFSIVGFLFVLWVSSIILSTKTTNFRKLTTPAPTATPSAMPFGSAYDEPLWVAINNWRQSQNLSSYTKDDRLCAIAKERSEEIDSLGHGDDHEGFLKKYGNYPYVLSENITGYSSVQDALGRWLNSPSHKATLIANYKYSCISCGYSECVQIFSNF